MTTGTLFIVLRDFLHALTVNLVKRIFTEKE